MTVSQSFLGGIYTGKDNALVSYQVSKLEITKPCLVRYNKFSENGISLTICDIASTLFTSKVSKSGAEKGIKPVVKDPGEVLLFSINAQMKRDGAPSDEAGCIETIAGLFKAKEVKEGQIFFLSCDFAMIPPKGFDAETLEFMGKKKDSTLFKVHPFSNDEEFISVVEELGFNTANWTTALETLTGNEFKEMQGGYTKKGFKELLEERIVLLETIVPNEQIRILRALGYGDACQKGQEETFAAIWQVIAEKLLTNI